MQLYYPVILGFKHFFTTSQTLSKRAISELFLGERKYLFFSDCCLFLS